jgi:ubiquinone/menaquinone biosynthesis C-methylase UbiE
MSSRNAPRRDPAHDLHAAFRDPRRDSARALTGFLEDADRLPGTRTIQLAMRRALALRPGLRLLDAGCGVGLETSRLAAAHPHTRVVGLDRNAELLEIARRRGPQPPNVQWLEADLAALDFPEASFDAIRTERVLMYLPDGAFERVLGELARLLCPGGRLALFELDYGATILAPGTDAGAAQAATEALRAALPQPLAGRRIPGLLIASGLRNVVATPFSFAVTASVWRRIVRDTLTAGPALDPGVRAWLREQEAAVARGEFAAAFTGVLTTAQRGRPGATGAGPREAAPA